MLLPLDKASLFWKRLPSGISCPVLCFTIQALLGNKAATNNLNKTSSTPAQDFRKQPFHIYKVNTRAGWILTSNLHSCWMEIQADQHFAWVGFVICWFFGIVSVFEFYLPFKQYQWHDIDGHRELFNNFNNIVIDS